VKCRREFKGAGKPPPCEEDGGILPDGTCTFGMPELQPRNRKALRFYADMKVFGYQGAIDIHGLPGDPWDRWRFLERIRVIENEANRLVRDRMEKGNG